MISGHGLNGRETTEIATETVVICGAGGHARVVADVLLSQSPAVEIEGFLDDRVELHGTEQSGKPVLGSIDSWLEQSSKLESVLIVGIGDNRDRALVADKISLAGFGFTTAVHSSARLGHGVQIGAGSVLMANTVVNAGSVIGKHVIINTSASVDHDCVVEDFSHISPGVNLAGDVIVELGVHIGIGACVVPGVRIGEGAIVGAGATVVNDVPPHTTVVGTPAMPIKKRSASK